MLFQNLYTIFISFWGFGKVKRDYELIEDKTRFLILVAAHNEESVIENTINNLNEINYNTDLFDIYIVNDNSTDSTGEVCDKLGIKHIDTLENLYPREGVGDYTPMRIVCVGRCSLWRTGCSCCDVSISYSGFPRQGR